MVCLCKQEIVKLAQSMVGVSIAPGFQLALALPGLDIMLPKLALQIGALTAAAQTAKSAASLSLAASLPSLPLPSISLNASLMAKLAGLSMGVKAPNGSGHRLDIANGCRNSTCSRRPCRRTPRCSTLCWMR